MSGPPHRLAVVARRALRTPPRRLVRAVNSRSRAAVAGPAAEARDATAGTHPPLPAVDQVVLTRLLVPAPGTGGDLLAAAAPPGEAAAVSAWMSGRADLLGTGWVRLAHGEDPPGLAGIAFPAEGVTADPGGRWLRGRVPTRALARSQAAWRLISPGHVPIDWHRDHRSGFRWEPTAHRRRITYGDVRGADVKGPWELSRAQHLPVMAAHGLSMPVVDQILDFIATNPPRYGVNWSCTMDVAIRVANWLVALDLLAAAGQPVHGEPLQHIGASVEAHARFIATHLEWFPDLRSNHYLANLAGLLACAAYLPTSPQADAWLAFAAAELASEAEQQFLPEGTCFEGSTSYHRLSGELLTWSVVLLRAVPGVAERLAAAAHPGGADRRLLPAVPGPPVDLGASLSLLDATTDSRLRRIADFVLAYRTPDGLSMQVGDTDSGRYLKLSTSWGDGMPPGERHGDHMALIAAIGGLLGDEALTSAAGPLHRRSVVAASAGRRQAGAGPLTARAAPHVRAPAAPPTAGVGTGEEAAGPAGRAEVVIEVVPGGRGIADGAVAQGFPHFGLYVHTSKRVWLAVRCGPVGQRGNGGHAHADQLAVELWVDGEPWVRDPGTFVYTPMPEVRNTYRSVGAHLAPWVGDAEPNPLGLGLFTIPDTTRGSALAHDVRTFTGSHEGFGERVVRHIALMDDRVRIVDLLPPPAVDGHHVVTTAAELAALLPAPVPHSPSYGVVEQP